MPKIRPKSRVKRWTDAAGKVRSAFDELVSALDELASIKEEYEEWKDNLPENLENSPLGEKLTAVVDLDIDGPKDDMESLIDDLENADLPLGFGRD